jgi:hypothetical protein
MLLIAVSIEQEISDYAKSDSTLHSSHSTLKADCSLLLFWLVVAADLIF